METPSHLNDIGKAAFARIVAECRAAELDVDHSYDVLERYAVTYTLWLECQARIRKEGQTIDGERNQRLVDYHKFTALLGRLRSELGLKPSHSIAASTVDDDADDEAAVVYRFAVGQ